ncbi:MAG: hypothetical protein ACD_16C00100G0001 [uncultured bacterium]|nr:MAG: hypothetical protein ACD_16C00100G0001 [uncultured bacterium]OFW68125.1 MAG: hypothetical protein A2X70_05430 [Alphaproteobacteria bacterium GWC2_42_16]OFW73517.1 MAG: hypothetical protein A2Z80_06730 [Alphaproteobacteria bacterium GWA2_41_27]OFW82366.1 MAG: hypothetical protein A3E50_04130 [Alphaproteobacteria bacterium RIFCSPHIGHO2_12_FULL_42_100]OFW86192.1 MAG: hypothetical protein A2W06_01060 [Alphaproteobacteria bacterium RBG_16_42_14]OFW91751.1 MAG: hypothetical protein A3C41_011
MKISFLFVLSIILAFSHSSHAVVYNCPTNDATKYQVQYATDIVGHELDCFSDRDNYNSVYKSIWFRCEPNEYDLHLGKDFTNKKCTTTDPTKNCLVACNPKPKFVCPTTKVSCPKNSETEYNFFGIKIKVDTYDIAYYTVGTPSGPHLKCNKVNSKNKLKGDFGYARPTISCPANCKVQLSPNFKTVLGVERCETDDPTDGRCYMTCVPE